jgi:xanthine dehydrogenase YagS FAD-binding subunit
MEAESALVGRRLDATAIERAADASVAGAKPLHDNAFKVALAKRSVARALEVAGGAA